MNDGLGLQRIKSSSPSFKKSLINANLFGEEKDDNILSDISNLKKENEDLNKKVIEGNGELKKLKETNSLILTQKNELKMEYNKAIKENNELKFSCEKLKNEILILNEKISNLNNEIQDKNNENENLTTKINSMILTSNEKFELTKEIFEQNVKELRKENRSWRKALEEYIGKKTDRDDKEENKNCAEKISDINNHNMDINENKEENKNKRNDKNEIMKLRIALDNLRTENSILKCRLANNEKNNSNLKNNIIVNSTINSSDIKNEDMANKNKITELINKNKENEEIIKKLEE